MNDFIFLDNNLDNNSASAYDLSIQVSLDGFSFCIHHNEQCLALKTVDMESAPTGMPSEHIKELMLNEPLLNLHYGSIHLLWTNAHATLIPAPLFSKSIAQKAFELCYPLGQDHRLLWQKSSMMDVYLVYDIPLSLLDFFQTQFPGLHIYHHSFPFIQGAKTELHGNHPIVNLHVENDFINLLIIGKGNNHFFNTFAYRNHTDLAYHVLNTYGQKKLNTQQSSLVLSGKIRINDPATDLLQRYLPNIIFSEENQKSIPELSSHQHNQFVNLLNIHLCEL